MLLDDPQGISLESVRFMISCGHWDGVPQPIIEQTYTDGWNAAMKAAQEQGKSVFLLNELLRRMGAGDEWYGTSFDEPIAIVKKVLTEIEKE